MNDAQAEGLNGDVAEIPKDILEKSVQKKNPWETTKYLEWANKADTDNDGTLSSKEYLLFRKAQNNLEDSFVKKGVMCIVDIGADLKESRISETKATQLREKCAAIKSKENCFNECKWYEPEFSADNEWKGLI